MSCRWTPEFSAFRTVSKPFTGKWIVDAAKSLLELTGHNSRFQHGASWKRFSAICSKSECPRLHGQFVGRISENTDGADIRTVLRFPLPISRVIDCRPHLTCHRRSNARPCAVLQQP